MKVREGGLREKLVDLDRKLYNLNNLYSKFAGPLELPTSTLLIHLSWCISSSRDGGSALAQLRMGDVVLSRRVREAWTSLIQQAESLHFDL
jgi:hypothetical protein